MNTLKVACPFCKRTPESTRGEGCCNCDHTGMVPIHETLNFKTVEEALNHDPEVSYYDLNQNRLQGRELNFKPFLNNYYETNYN